MMDLPLLALTLLTFFIAGLVKGVVGLGLPTVAVGLIALFYDLPTAMILFLAPAFVTNIWQATYGGHGRVLLRRLWVFLVLVIAFVFVGAQALVHIDLDALTAILGFSLCVYAVLSLMGAQLSFAPYQESWAGPLMGALNGTLTGMTGSFAVPGIMYLQALGLKRDELIQAMGLLFCLSTLALGLALGRHNFIDGERGLYSVLAIAPALLGMRLGQSVRAGLSEALFRRLFFIAILILGLFILARALLF